MARKTARNETAEQTLARWIKGAGKGTYQQVLEMGWEAGQNGHIEVDGLRYEKFFVAADTYVVIEWDESGETVVL